MDRLFLDADIVMDFLAKRAPFHQFADEIFNLSDKGEVNLVIASLTFSHLHYVLAKQAGKDQARQTLNKFKTLIKVASIGDKIIDLALSSEFKDFEDAIQYYAAIENNCSMILTRNIKDYKESSIPVMTAESYTKLYK